MLSQTAPLQTAPDNIDAALAQVLPGTVDTTGMILDLSAIGTSASPSMIGIADPASVLMSNETVAKSGAGSGLTCSTINSMDNSIQVNYSTECGGKTTFSVVYNNQIVFANDSFAVLQDSGSLIVTADKARPVALLVAASGSFAFATPIQSVLNQLTDPNTGEIPTIVGGPDHPVSCPAAAQAQIGTATRAELREQARSLPDAELQRAGIVKSAHLEELLRDPAVTGLDVSASEDDPREAAVVVYTNAPQAHVPHIVDGVRTRVLLNAGESAAGLIPRIGREELLRGISVKERHASELMSNPAIIGVGVGASHDNPAESAIVIFIEQGKQAAVPAEIDGVRTRIQFTDRFRAFGWGKSAPKSCSVKGPSDQVRTSDKPLLRGKLTHTGMATFGISAQPDAIQGKVPRQRDAR
jgi:hypothetical protein